MPTQEGFHDQRLSVVPRRIVAEALARPVTRRLVVTDAGHYPNARGHLMTRPSGAEETIVIVCVSGTGWASIGGVQHRLGSNTALVISPGTPHAYGASEANPWTIWWSHLRGSDLPELVAEMDVSAAKPIVPIRHVDRTVALLDEVVTTMERNHSPASLVGAAGAAWKLLTQIIVDRTLPEPGDPLQRAMDYLAERSDGTMRVAELAALVGVSPSHLSAQFRRATGGGVLAHQTALRMARARQLLDTTKTLVSEIAREVGYDDQFYFSRRFRRMHEASPSEYRARDKG
jgi:AraC-like DNA-binding protein